MTEDNKSLFMKQIIKFIFSRKNLIMFLLVCIIVSFLFVNNILDTHQSNYTWIYSTSMQTLAALIALLPISYSYFLRKLDDQKSKEFDAYILKKLEKDVYFEMMFVIFFSLFTIVINLFYLFYKFEEVYALVSAFFTLLSVQFVVLYIHRLFDPDRVKDLLKEFDIDTIVDPSQKTMTLDQFITQYLVLETVVKDYISNENTNLLIDEMPLYDIVDNLSKDFPVIEQNFNVFKEIIFHRNNLIHNYNQVVIDYNKYLKIEELIKMFTKLNEQFVAENIFSNATAVKNLVEAAANEYMGDIRNKEDIKEKSHIASYEETLSSILSTYFISDYFLTLDFLDSADSDFQVVQNNYSNKKLVAIELKMTSSSNFAAISTAFFTKFKNKFLYIFILNYNYEENYFEVNYLTKDKRVRYDTIKLK